MQFNRLLILESALKSTIGHHYEYIKSVSDAAKRRGMEVIVTCNREVEEDVRTSLNVLPLFRMSHYDKAIGFTTGFLQQTGKRLNGLVYAWRFFKDCSSKELLHSVDSRTIIFIPTATEVGTLGVTLWMKWEGLKRGARVVCLLRYDPRQFARRIVAVMKSMIRQRRIMLATDSNLLAEDYRKATGEEFTVLPIPHLPDFQLAEIRTRRGVRILFLGGARAEKGIIPLVEAIKHLLSELHVEGVEFHIQCNTFLYEDETVEALRDLDILASMHPTNIKLIKTPLSTDEYYRLLMKADIVVMPYQRSEYISRSSGILAEAFAAAKPVVVTEGTWMSAQLKHYGAGMTCKDQDARDLARVMRASILSIDRLLAEARVGRAAWLEVHSAERLLDIITSPWGETSPDGVANVNHVLGSSN